MASDSSTDDEFSPELIECAAKLEKARSPSAGLGAQTEVIALELEHLKHELAKEEIRGATQDREERKTFSKLIYRLAASWLAGVGLLLFLQGFGARYGFFGLADGVIKILLGATTLIAGLMAAQKCEP
jgi:hypothetical protein